MKYKFITLPAGSIALFIGSTQAAISVITIVLGIFSTSYFGSVRALSGGLANIEILYLLGTPWLNSQLLTWVQLSFAGFTISL